MWLWEDPQTLHFYVVGVSGRVHEPQNKYCLYLETRTLQITKDRAQLIFQIFVPGNVVFGNFENVKSACPTRA